MLYLCLLLLGASAPQGAAPAPQPAARTLPPTSAAPPMTVTLRFAEPAKRSPTPYEAVNRLIIFKANVAGRDVWALLDTGAGSSLIDLAFARDAGLSVGAPEGTINTPTGSLPKRRVSDVPVVIPGQWEARAPALAAIDLKPTSDMVGRKIDFVLGANFLSPLAVLIDPGRSTFQMGPSGAVKMSPGFPSAPLQNGKSHVEVMIGGRPAVVAIDTGFTGALTLTPAAWARIGSKDAKLRSGAVVHGEGERYMVDIAEAPEVVLGPMRSRNVDVQIRPLPPEHADGLLGMGFLDRYFFVLDQGAGKLWLAPRLPSAVKPQPAEPHKPG